METGEILHCSEPPRLATGLVLGLEQLDCDKTD